MAKKKTSITLDDDTLGDLDRMAKNSHRSRSGMISFLVDLFKTMVLEPYRAEIKHLQESG